MVVAGRQERRPWKEAKVVVAGSFQLLSKAFQCEVYHVSMPRKPRQAQENVYSSSEAERTDAGAAYAAKPCCCFTPSTTAPAAVFQ